MMFEISATVGCSISKEVALKEITLFILSYSISGKFKHHKKLENVKFEETNDAILILMLQDPKKFSTSNFSNFFYEKWPILWWPGP